MDAQTINMDAFADGQVRSKIWACQEIENLVNHLGKPAHVWILGSWYAMLPFFLLLRDRASFSGFSLFDRDPEAQRIATKVLRNWTKNPELKVEFILGDCSSPDCESYKSASRPDIVVNTSCEHFHDCEWFKAVPSGVRFLVQSTDMPHIEHVLSPRSVDELAGFLGTYQSEFTRGTIEFKYPNSSFRRFMISGVR